MTAFPLRPLPQPDSVAVDRDRDGIGVGRETVAADGSTPWVDLGQVPWLFLERRPQTACFRPRRCRPSFDSHGTVAVRALVDPDSVPLSGLRPRRPRRLRRARWCRRTVRRYRPLRPAGSSADRCEPATSARSGRWRRRAAWPPGTPAGGRSPGRPGRLLQQRAASGAVWPGTVGQLTESPSACWAASTSSLGSSNDQWFFASSLPSTGSIASGSSGSACWAGW